MLNRAFYFDFQQRCWRESHDADYINAEIEDIPHVLAVRDKSDRPGQYFVLCPKHRCIEAIVSICPDSVVTESGCNLQGRVCLLDHSIRDDEDSPYFPVRWRVFQRDPESPLNIAGDISVGPYLQNRHNPFCWQNFAISVSLPRRKHFISPYTTSYHRSQENWIDATEVEMPDIVVSAAMDALRESTRAVWGIKPSDLSQMTGRRRILAYIDRPFDLNISYLRNFFSEYEFDSVFPYDAKDNYRVICRLLAMNPPKSLRRAYAYNPYAIIWYLVLREWGLKDINHIRPFLRLDRNICGIGLDQLCYHEDTKITGVLPRSHEHHRWRALGYFCRWLLEKKGEARVAQWLYQTTVETPLTDWQWDTIRAFHEYDHCLSDGIKEYLLRDGLTQYVHDMISWEVTVHTKKLVNVHLDYAPPVLAFECAVNGYEFRLARTTETLRYIGHALANCVATYRSDVINHHSIIVSASFEGHFAACIELQQENHIVQALGSHNRYLDGDLLLACRCWAKTKGLIIDTWHLDLPPELTDWEDAVVSDLPPQELPDPQDISGNRRTSATDRRELNRYEIIEQDIMNTMPHRIQPPPWMTFADERAYLRYVLPAGEEIYEAAFAQDAEAQRTLGLIYLKGKIIAPCPQKAIYWFSRAGAQGDEDSKWAARKLIAASPAAMTQFDIALFLALQNLRQRFGVTVEPEVMGEAAG
ncbi:MAG: PcfJ domain-containing protein [Schwartzia sp.]|nr:PcfJ domain-containing protein [Schwartzia sp. (in: firmicutes)]